MWRPNTKGLARRRRNESGADGEAVKQHGRMFQAGHSPPCITARRGGRAIKKISRSSADREAGVVFRWMQKENHPGCVRFGRCATFFLMTQPPLAVMQG